MENNFICALITPFLLISSSLAATCATCTSPISECHKSCPDFEAPCPPDTPLFNVEAFRDTKCGWDLFATGSFLYWQAGEQNLNLFSSISTQDDENSSAHTATTSIMIQFPSPSFDFKPGFKVGLGIFFYKDNWNLYAEYLRYHNTPGKNDFSSNKSFSEITIYPIPTQSNTIVSSNFSNFHASWELNLDLVDLQLGRECYVGKSLTFNPHFGVRAAWINQKYENTALINGELNVGSKEEPSIIPFLGTTASISSSKNWGVGAVAGLDTKWEFCSGFRLFANTEASILYTDYTDIKIEGTFDSSLSSFLIVHGMFFENTSAIFLIPQANLELGIGWGDYFFCNSWHLDIALGYEFNLFWDQNVFPNFNNSAELKVPAYANGNLYFHGVTLTVALEF